MLTVTLPIPGVITPVESVLQVSVTAIVAEAVPLWHPPAVSTAVSVNGPALLPAVKLIWLVPWPEVIEPFVIVHA